MKYLKLKSFNRYCSFSFLCGIFILSACQTVEDPSQKVELFLQEIQDLEQTISLLETSLEKDATFSAEQQKETKDLLEQLMQMESEMDRLSAQHQLDQDLLAETNASIQAAKQQIWDSFYGNYNKLANNLANASRLADSLQYQSQSQSKEIQRLKSQLNAQSQDTKSLRAENLQTLTIKGNRKKTGVSFLDRRFDSLKVSFDLHWPEQNLANKGADIYLVCQNADQKFMSWGEESGVYKYFDQYVPFTDKISALPNDSNISMLLIADTEQKLEKGIYTVSLMANKKLIGQTRFELGW